MVEEGTIVVQCDCRVCKGRKARVSALVQPSKTMVHNLVCIAHGPLAKVASVRQHGPWAVL